jgi:HEAT repeat protein
MPAVARAVLDAKTRTLVQALLRKDLPAVGTVVIGDVAVRDGELLWELEEDGPGVIQDVIPRALAFLLDLARRLSPPSDLPGRVAENLATEPEWRVRLESVRVLAAHTGHAAARAALSRACGDERAEVRLEAALARGGEEARATLVEIALLASTDDALAARAVARLDEGTPRDVLLRLLGSALRTRRAATAVACLGRLGALGGSEVVHALQEVLAIEGGELAAAAVRALGACGTTEAEPSLLEALGHAEAPVRVAAAEALGRVGSIAAVLPLQEAADGHRFDGELRRACRQAVAQVQARLPGASPGQLSLAAGDEGRLSLAEPDASGRVSIAESHEPR